MFGVAGASPKNLLIYGITQRHLRECAARYLRGRLLDIGCGEKPFAALVAPHVDEHVGVDHAGTVHDTRNVDIVSDCYTIPVEDGSFDSVLCTAVLEHLEEPELALRECHRTLRPGGVALYTVPFMWHLHEEPRDFYRFTRYSLRYLFDKVGFDVVELRALSGFWVTAGQMLVYNLHRFNRGPLRWLRVVDALGLLLQGAAWLLDRIDRKERWTWMYLVVARKRAGAEASAAQAPTGTARTELAGIDR